MRDHDIGRREWNARDASRVLRGERRDRAGAVDAERGEGLQIGLNARAAARIRAGDGQRDPGSRRARRRDPFAGSRLRIGVQRDVGDDRDDIGAGGEARLAALDVEAADRDQRNVRRRAASIRRCVSRPCGANAIAFRIVG